MPFLQAPASKPWQEFKIDGPYGDEIPLRQISAKLFHLGDVTITYTGNTGLDKFVKRGELRAEQVEEVRTINNDLLPETDLASVPGPLRWFTNTYGPHTPAALIHDYLIPDEDTEPLIPEVHADRYFRFMLGSVGVPFFKRFIMWAAVAMRTRFKAKPLLPRALLVLWALTSLAGLATFAITAPSMFFGAGDVLGTQTTLLFVLSCLAPFGCSAMWGRQWGAGITAALAAPWLLPAALVTVLGYIVYLGLEYAGRSIAVVTSFVQRLAATASA